MDFLRSTAVMGAFMITYPRDQIKSVLFIFVFARITFIPAAFLIGVWFVSQLFHAGAVAHTQTGGVAYWRTSAVLSLEL
jgi:membrane associated rhomboid family serine protease